MRRVFFYQPGYGVHYYHPAVNDWSEVKAKGTPPPFGIDSTCCYDPRRDRIYLGGGSYPVATGDNALWIWDVKTDSWVDPKPKGKPCNGSNSYATNIAAMHYDSANDAVLVFRHTGSAQECGVFAYDAAAQRVDDGRQIARAVAARPGQCVLRPAAERTLLPCGGRQRRQRGASWRTATSGQRRPRESSAMAITCPRCGSEFDATLFQFGHRVRYHCGAEIEYPGAEFADSPCRRPR